jgi:3-isopropylmalate/(R)-2-methylmalate dehydratase small subunit
MSVSRITHVSGRAIPCAGTTSTRTGSSRARYLKAVVRGLEAHVFADDRSDPAHAFNQPQYQGARVLLVNRNFGCGSSREHAPQALQRWGISAIVGEGYSEIFFGNSLQLGLPCLTVSQDEIERLMAVCEADPTSVVDVDVAGLSRALRVDRGEGNDAEARIRALTTGLWDGTGLLLDDFEQVRQLRTSCRM